MNTDTGNVTGNFANNDAGNERQTYNRSYFYRLNQELSGQAEIEPYQADTAMERPHTS